MDSFNYVLQSEITGWHDTTWGDAMVKPSWIVLAKLQEEVGELAGAMVKNREGRRTHQDIRDEFGDVMIVLAVLANRLGIDAASTMAARWSTVKLRTNPNPLPNPHNDL